MASPLTIISSMATRQLLADLVAEFRKTSAQEVRVESVGGVDAAKRVLAGEAFDIVALASNAIAQLTDAGRIVPGSQVDVVQSGVAIAVCAGAPRPDIGSEAAVKQAVLNAKHLSYSTGPSGTPLTRLFERWGLTDTLRDRIVQPPPGVPVGSLVARGEVELGFQQLSELMHMDGIDVVGTLPPEVAFITTFSGALCASSSLAGPVRTLLEFMASPEADPAKQRHGMTPA